MRDIRRRNRLDNAGAVVMSDTKLNELPLSTLKPMALGDAYWLEDHGFLISDLVNLRTQDPEVCQSIILAKKLVEDKLRQEREKKAGMNGRVGTEA